MKDLFIDNNVAKNFANPLDIEYKKLIKWLIKNDRQYPDNNAYLVVSNKLLGEYSSSSALSPSNTSMPVIIDMLTREGRLNKISNNMIKAFKRLYFSKVRQNKMRSNIKDRDHIPVVLLSHRKFALSIDRNFIHDLKLFTSYRVTVEKRPESLPYE